MRIFIPYNVPSLKNSKQFYINKRTGKAFITSSNSVKEYIINTKGYYDVYRKDFLKLIDNKQLPYLIELQFIRETKRRFDFINMAQIVLDLMVSHNWITDDSYDIVNPSFNSEVLFDKVNPGVYIEVK